jgi:hypothetical protein
MKLNEVAAFLQERLFAITGNGGKNDHVHRVDFSNREGKTSIDEKHYHNYRLGDKVTTGTVLMPANADVKPHDHSLPMLLKEGQDFERVFAFLSTLEKSDLQQLANPLNEPKPNAPLDFRIESHPYEGIKLKMTFFDTGNKYAMESLGRYITPMLKEVGINPNRVHYHVLAYHPPMPPMSSEEEPRLPAVDFEHVQDKASLTMAVAIVGQHAIKESVEEDQLDEGVNPRKLALNLTAVFKVLKGNSSTTRDAVLDTFGILDEKNRRVVSTWVLDLLGASRRATGTAASSEGVREGQEASTAGIVAFDLLDVINELVRNKAATSKAVKDSFRSLSAKEKSTISNWVAAMVNIVTPKG